MRFCVLALAASIALFAVPAAAQSSKATVQVQCTAYAASGPEPIPMIYHTPLVAVLESAVRLWELNKSWHELLATRGYTPSERAVASCNTVDPRYPTLPIAGEQLAWTPPANYLPKPRTAAPKPAAPTPEAKSDPLAPASSAKAAELAPVKTPNQLKYERELAEHQRLLAERERAIADAAARHAANREAAEAELAKHEGALATHRETVAQMERDAAAVRAEWAARAAAATGQPIAPAALAGETTVRRVHSTGGGGSEQAARDSLLNGFYKQFGPITNVQCSSILFNGRPEWTCSGDQAVTKVQTQSASGQ